MGVQKLTFMVLRHAYYLTRLKRFGLMRDGDVAVGELGSGAAELAILTKRLFPACKYVCFDLPEPLLVGSYNLLMTFPQLKVGLFENFRQAGRITREDIEKYDIVMLPNWCIEWVETDALDVFINIGSLSEMDRALIENYLRIIERVCRGSFYTVNRNIASAEWDSSDVPLDEFPFSEPAKVIYRGYNIASDIFHATYRRSNMWEVVVEYLK